ncbi:Flp pilus assembly protein CpaB [Brackiella oedipodis]|uniref:Flp pilus assembly protein CpaB n=1 Tax=Brackiella oedipodis TaxID=124225 RepID=UPI000A0109E9|nr:Flp pilus assembly protein CpaB [Brackiella oedipodis]
MNVNFNKKSVIVLVLALGAGVLAAWSAQQYISAKIAKLEQDAQVKTVPRIVAAYDLPVGTKLSADHVAVRQIPVPWIISGSISPEEFNKIKGQVITTALKIGDPVLWANTASAKNKPFSDKIAYGRRALTIPVDTINSVSGMLVPGDLIDLYVSFEYRKKQITAPLLQGVLVMATGKQSRQGGDFGEEASTFSTVTLDTAPEEAAKLVAARQSGTITALLRNPEDNQATRKGVRGDLAGILGISQPMPTIKRKPVVVYGNDKTRRLPELNATIGPKTPSTNQAVFDLPQQDDIVSAWMNSLPPAHLPSDMSITAGVGENPDTDHRLSATGSSSLLAQTSRLSQASLTPSVASPTPASGADKEMLASRTSPNTEAKAPISHPFLHASATSLANPD